MDSGLRRNDGCGARVLGHRGVLGSLVVSFDSLAHDERKWRERGWVVCDVSVAWAEGVGYVGSRLRGNDGKRERGNDGGWGAGTSGGGRLGQPALFGLFLVALGGFVGGEAWGEVEVVA